MDTALQGRKMKRSTVRVEAGSERGCGGKEKCGFWMRRRDSEFMSKSVWVAQSVVRFSQGCLSSSSSSTSSWSRGKKRLSGDVSWTCRACPAQRDSVSSRVWEASLLLVGSASGAASSCFSFAAVTSSASQPTHNTRCASRAWDGGSWRGAAHSFWTWAWIDNLDLTQLWTSYMVLGDSFRFEVWRCSRCLWGNGSVLPGPAFLFSFLFLYSVCIYIPALIDIL